MPNLTRRGLPVLRLRSMRSASSRSSIRSTTPRLKTASWASTSRRVGLPGDMVALLLANEPAAGETFARGSGYSEPGIAGGLMKIFLPSITSARLLPFVLASSAHAQVRVYQLSGEAPGLRLGTAVSAAGDVDLDGVPDYLVGGSPTVTGSYGQVLVISGRHGTVLHTLASNVADDGFGASVLGVGDLDLDGVPDAIVGSPTALVHDPLHLGAVRAFSGRTGSLLWLVRSPEGFGSTGFGKAIAEIGDLDGDGIPEIAAGPCPELGWMGNGTIT